MANPGAVRPGDPPWLRIAFQELEAHVREKVGSADNPRIRQYLQSTNLGKPDNQNDETPWCGAFANHCVEKSGHEGTNSARARDWLGWGQKTSEPVRGCLVVFSRGAAQGHVGFFIEKTGATIRVLGGNQSDAVTISGYPESRLLGYRLGPGQEEVDVTEDELRRVVRDEITNVLDSQARQVPGIVSWERYLEVLLEAARKP